MEYRVYGIGYIAHAIWEFPKIRGYLGSTLAL